MEIDDLLPLPSSPRSSTTEPDSVPFLLVRPPSSMPSVASDVIDDDQADTGEIPSSKSVPPHVPPTPVVTTENELPSVIVDLRELEVNEMVELQRASEVDGLLTASETIEFPDPPILVEEEPAIDTRIEASRSVVRRSSGSGRLRGLAIAAVAALSAAGGTFAGMKVCHVPGGSLGAALHVVR